MKTNLKSGVFSPTTRMQALQWATVAVAIQHSKYFELDGVIRVGDDIRNLDPVRWKYDHSKRLGQIMDKDMPCIRSVEDMVFLRMLSIQVKCYADLLDGITEDPAHIQECRSLMEEYIGNHGSRIQSSPAMLINKGLLFLTRSWGQISRVATLVTSGLGFSTEFS